MPLLLTNHQPPTVNSQQRTINHQPTTNNHQQIFSSFFDDGIIYCPSSVMLSERRSRFMENFGQVHGKNWPGANQQICCYNGFNPRTMFPSSLEARSHSKARSPKQSEI